MSPPIETSLIKLLLGYAEWEAAVNNGLSIQEFPKELQPLFSVVDNFHSTQNDEKANLTVHDLANLLFANTSKDHSYYKELLPVLDKLDVSDKTSKVLLNTLVRNRHLKELSLAAYDVTEGRTTPEKFQSLLDGFKALGEVSGVVEEDEDTFVTDDLEQLVHAAVSQPGLRWRLNTLNRMLGSLRKGNFGFVFARPESFSRDTEVLTTVGWKTVDSVTMLDEIAQVDDQRNITFVNPLSIHTHEQTEVVHIHDKLGRVDLQVTKGHAMVIEKRGKLVKERADEVQYYQNIKHHVSGFGIGNAILSPQDRLAIAYQADGVTRQYKDRLMFSLKKKRKIDRLEALCDACGYEYSLSQHKSGHWYFYIHVNDNRYYVKDFSWVDLKNVGVQFASDFIEELSYWDATRRTENRYKFDTTTKEVSDIVQAICALAGYNCLVTKFEDDRKESFKDIYSHSIRTKYQPVDGQCIKKEIVPFTDTTYCFKVPTGMLLIRRNGASAICGNTGKTTFLASEVTFMATQLSDEDGPIIWLANEEPGVNVKLRVYQAFFGIDLVTLMSDIPAWSAKFLKESKGKIKILDKAIIHKSTVEKLCKKYKPSLLIVDQIDKITGFDNDREDLRLGSIYQWFRELAKTYCPVIGICQADGTGEGVKWLTMGHVANAKTAKQAEADWILGLGKQNADGYENIRYAHLSKNKLLGDSDTDPNLRHGKCEILIEPKTARYKDLM